MRKKLSIGILIVLAGMMIQPFAVAAEDRKDSPAPSSEIVTPAPLSCTSDWRWVKGAVFVPTKCVNQAQQWDEYDPVINDRELRYASTYGINCVRVYLHYFIYLKKKDALLNNIEDFLARADKYGLKTEFVFFDDCWNQPEKEILSPDYRYPAPIAGVHNSRWLESPGQEVGKHYAEHKDRLKAYVQDIVNAHKTDKRIAFWETYNEPNKSWASTKQLLKDAYDWIHETGTTIPLTATGRDFAGDPYSDFKSWHFYSRDYDKSCGGPNELNTECMRRPAQTARDIVEHYAGKTGFIIWELGIGRDNCRFGWNDKTNSPCKNEPSKPFHGLIYPDGHPWDVEDVKALLGAEGFANAPLFAVEYYKDANFTQLAKKSVTPLIDFDLGTEPGTGSPDASAGVPIENFSGRWTGTILPPTDGNYTFSVDGDNQVKLFVGSELLIDKKTAGRGEVSREIKLTGGQPVEVRIDYVHATGEPSLHIAWSGPGFARQILTPMKPQTRVGIRVVTDVKASGLGGWYGQNRGPLQPVPFMKLPIGNIVPQGWLRTQLELDANGIVGRIQEISDFVQFDKTGWVHPEKNGWEEVSYWLRGYGDLAYVLKDPKMIAESRRWIEAVIATQDADGYFGPHRFKPKSDDKQFPDAWGHMPMLHVLRSCYEFNGDEKALQCLVKYFKWLNTMPVAYFSNTEWARFRWADTLSTTYWIYNITGEPWLLDLSRKIQEHSRNWTKGLASPHNVNIAQGIRQPAEYWMQANDPVLLGMTERNYRAVMDEYGQFPGGGFAGDENTRRGYTSPRQGFETCGFAEFMLTFETMSKISGDPVWADRNEEIAFNSFPAALTPDHKGIHYITPANVIQLDDDKKTKGQFQDSWALLAFKPGMHQYRCCPHNYGMGWAYYAEELWLATHDKGLCAMLYAASEVSAKVGDGTEVKLTETTDYPFGDTIEFKLSTPKPVRFPLYLRVPRWCNKAALTLNGKAVNLKAAPLSYVVIDREWADGDQVGWTLPMQTAIRTWPANNNAVSLDYGPLSFSLNLGEKWEQENHPGERGDHGTAAWPQWKVTATKPWNYGLVLDARTPEIEVVRREGPVPANPFTPETAPLELRVKAKRVPQWGADSEQVVTSLPQSPVMSDEPVETVRLIPMGAARLRITAFPTILGGPIGVNTKKGK